MPKFSDIPTSELENWFAEFMKIHNTMQARHEVETVEQALLLRHQFEIEIKKFDLPMEVLFSVFQTGAAAALATIIQKRKREANG